jgi:transketolase
MEIREETDRATLVRRLNEVARQLRISDIEMLAEAGSGHPGGTLSAADMVAALFFYKLRLRPDDATWPDRDRFVLSKGHCIPIVYAAMAELGMIDRELLFTLRKLDSPLQGHPDRTRLPAVEASTGSLGQGLSVAVGMALAGKLDGARWRVYCMTGDGEIQAGQIWEAAMFAPRHGLDNLCVIVDQNQVQQTGKVVDRLDIEPLAAKWRAFDWHVREIDGHDMGQIVEALDEAELVTGRPTAIISHTVKGKGVSWMELNSDWHGKTPDPEQTERALEELRAGAGGPGSDGDPG